MGWIGFKVQKGLGISGMLPESRHTQSIRGLDNQHVSIYGFGKASGLVRLSC